MFDVAAIEKIESIIGYVFKDKSLLTCAFTHTSFKNENQHSDDYERLEFLGDATLNFASAILLYKQYPTKTEGELTRIRASLVSAETLSKVIDSLGIINYLRTGTGNAHDWAINSSNVKCDLFESIIGAIIVDNNYKSNEALNFIYRNLLDYVCKAEIFIDFKSKVLEYCTKNSYVVSFDFFEEICDNQNHIFKVKLLIDGDLVALGEGQSKKMAEKAACKVFYENNKNKF